MKPLAGSKALGDLRSIFMGAFGLAGLFLLLWPYPVERWERARHDRRVGELNSGADTFFFEEQRALEAYPPPTIGRCRILGAAMVALSSVAILL
jgi:hypothetical protein